MRTKHETGAIENAYRNQPYESGTSARSGLARKSRVRLASVTTAGLAMLAFSQGALAANPTFEIIGPSEWNLPIVPSANVFIQTGIGQVSGKAWSTSGNRQDIPSTHLIAGITRFAHLFSLKAIPNTGFFWEVLVPEVSVYGHGNSVSGLGDPLLDLAAYWKPTPQSLIGFQNVVSTTFGNNDLSNHFWEYMPSIIGDVNIAKWELDGTLGAGFASDRHVNGTTTRIGNTYYAEASVVYHATDVVAPFVNFNYQSVEHSTDKATGAVMPGASPVFACANNGGCHENVVGAGVKWNFSPKRWVAVWYGAGVSGRNTVRTNAAYLRFVNIF
ncbi:MAG: transporter [Rhodanobacter sp.]|nr:MAG: transporter [Rhodanobacter sp.]TAM41395.1 MAG: transporter [Rhodanobacter sp.]